MPGAFSFLCFQRGGASGRRTGGRRPERSPADLKNMDGLDLRGLLLRSPYLKASMIFPDCSMSGDSWMDFDKPCIVW